MRQTFAHPIQQSKRPSKKSIAESKLKRLFQLVNSLIRNGKPSRFDYLLDKLQEARIQLDPFEHIYIENFLRADDFSEIIACPQISIGKSVSHEHLLLSLIDCGYGAQKFPGCTSSLIEYVRFLNGEIKSANIDTCETMGMALRLQSVQTTILENLLSFLSSARFVQLLVNKFNIKEKCHHDYGIQKYLTGYEISPHPDIKRKKLTYMLNINSDPFSETQSYHTHYLSFKNNHKQIYDFWLPESTDTCWVPWNWCKTNFIQNKNNSLVLFAPSNKSLHAIKCVYNDMEHQRTQVYGNLWSLENILEREQHTWHELKSFCKDPKNNISTES